MRRFPNDMLFVQFNLLASLQGDGAGRAVPHDDGALNGACGAEAEMPATVAEGPAGQQAAGKDHAAATGGLPSEGEARAEMQRLVLFVGK